MALLFARVYRSDKHRVFVFSMVVMVMAGERVNYGLTCERAFGGDNLWNDFVWGS